MKLSDYETGHAQFVKLYRGTDLFTAGPNTYAYVLDPEHGAWAKKKAFFWLFWAKYQEQFKLFDRAYDPTFVCRMCSHSPWQCCTV